MALTSYPILVQSWVMSRSVPLPPLSACLLFYGLVITISYPRILHRWSVEGGFLWPDEVVTWTASTDDSAYRDYRVQHNFCVNFVMRISLYTKGQLVLQPVLILTMITHCQYFSIHKKIFTEYRYAFIIHSFQGFGAFCFQHEMHNTLHFI
jgi:hypothetical protein